MKKTLFLLIFLFSIYCEAQHFLWTKSNGSLKNDACLSVFPTATGTMNLYQFGDSITLGSNKFYSNIPAYFLWIFRNQKGEITKYVRIQQDSVYKRNVRKLKNGRFFLTKVYSTYDSFYLDGKKINIKHISPIISIDTNGNTILFSEIKLLNNAFFRPYFQIESFGENIAVYFGLTKGIKIQIQDSIIEAKTNSTVFLLFNKNGKLLKSKIVGISTSPWGVDYCNSNHHRILSVVYNFNDSFIYNSKLYKFKQYHNLLTYTVDSSLNIHGLNALPGGTLSSQSITTYDTFAFFYNADFFIDSAKDSFFIGEFKQVCKKGRHTFIVFVSNNKIKFIKHFSNTNPLYYNPIQSITFSKHGSQCAVGAQIVNKLLIFPDSVYVDTDDNDGNICGMKIDTFANILWYFVARSNKSFDQFQSLILLEDVVYFSGNYLKTVVFGNDSVTAVGQSDAILFKITDNSLYRGNISPGPYCAGDSIFVPFKANGKYNDTNTFFAELSDENGNFYGSPRVLGSFKSKVSGTIRGKLPLFDVVSAAKYRIRVRSNSPFVQSFMRYDSFYLRVYSKDKARPGKDTTLCYGQRITVSAKGGTVWKWTPGTAVKDSTARVTEFVANTTTRLRIAISDTSGCGLPDTAFQTITVLPKLKAISDSIKVCVNQKLYLVGQSTGGKQADVQYDWIWRNTTTTAPFFTPTVNGDTALYLIARDQCSAPDTGIIIFKTYNAPKLITPDTLLCRNIPFTLAPKAIYDDPPQLPTYLWYTSNYLKVNNGNLISKVQSDTQFIVIVHDNCSQKRDTQTVRIRVHSLPTITSMLDSVCAINKHKLVFLAKAGLAPYQYFVNQIKQDSITLMPANGAQKLALQIQDACNSKSNTDTLQVFEQPRFKITIDKPKGCVPFTSIVETQNANQLLRFDWYNATSVISNNMDSIHVPIALVGKTNYKVLGYNAHCIDSINFELEGLPKPIADFSLSKTEMSIKEKQIRVLNASQNAIQYQFTWDKYNRSFTAIDTFYLNISDTGKFRMQLVATNTHGCTDTASKYFTVYPLPKVYFPTGFTANGDGLNETFYPKGLGVKSYHLQIYNRWGQAVFKGKENEPWTPTTSIFPGAYVFRCVITGWGETPEEYKGVVVLLK